MPEEFSRTTARKRIPIGTSFVDVPVITKISFIDPADRYQEWQYTIDNSGKSDRLVHVDTITGTNISLAVERIDRWTTLDRVDRGQETQMTMDNVTGADSTPPHFSTHVQTHVVRYKNPDDANVWIDSELIDSFTVIDPSDRYQEIRFILTNPESDDDAQADPNDPDISDQSNGVDPPWRTDPFQNIIDIHTETTEIVEQIFVFRRFGDNCSVANLAVAQSTGGGGDWYPVDRDFWIERESRGETSPAGTGGSSILLMSTIATRTLLSDLITACVSLSHQGAQDPGPLDGADGWNPWISWLDFSGQPQLSCDPGLENPKSVEQPSASNAPSFIYLGAIGFANTDDVGTGGPVLPPGTPTFVPPT